MTDFQIHALPEQRFADYLAMSDDELSPHNACWRVADTKPGSPCRVSLQDAEPGERLLLINFEHLPECSPFRASHAIFVRANAQQAHPAPNAVPELFERRPISVRAYDTHHHMIDADIADGTALRGSIQTLLADAHVAYLHLHYAKPGCFAARVTRA